MFQVTTRLYFPALHFPSDLPGTLRCMADLTDTHREMLAIEAGWWKYPGAKETAIMDRVGMTATRYYQVLNVLIDQPEALEHDPLLVKRLRRLRDARRARRRSISAYGL